MSRKDINTRRWRERTRPYVLGRDGGICQIDAEGCTVVATQVDHIIPYSLGGSGHVGNLRAACKTCNTKRSGDEARGRKKIRI